MGQSETFCDIKNPNWVILVHFLTYKKFLKMWHFVAFFNIKNPKNGTFWDNSKTQKKIYKTTNKTRIAATPKITKRCFHLHLATPPINFKLCLSPNEMNIHNRILRVHSIQIH